VTGFDDEEVSTDAAVTYDPADVLDSVHESQEALRQEFAELLQGFERLAGHLGPLLTKQYSDTQTRMRVLETRIRNRQERPLITQMADLLAEVRRLESTEDVKAHVEEAMLRALNSVGYQEMGSPGDQFDPAWHEPVSGAVGRAGIVTRVHRRGLACYGDVIIKAAVDVQPAPMVEDPAPKVAGQDAEPNRVTETEQGGLPV
jgi:molecular chaperone GrpE (heat shock protein)